MFQKRSCFGDDTSGRRYTTHHADRSLQSTFRSEDGRITGDDSRTGVRLPDSWSRPARGRARIDLREAENTRSGWGSITSTEINSRIFGEILLHNLRAHKNAEGAIASKQAPRDKRGLH